MCKWYRVSSLLHFSETRVRHPASADAQVSGSLKLNTDQFTMLIRLAKLSEK